MKTKAALLLAILLASLNVFANDGSTFMDLGFSSSKSRYAFIEYGIQDGSGFPYAHVQVIDVALNKLLNGKTYTLQYDGATVAQAIAKAKTYASTRGVKGTNLGRNLLINLPTDVSTKSNSIFTLDYVPGGTFLPRFEVVIGATDLPAKQECIGYASQLLNLSIAGRENTLGNTIVLQNDATLPGSRNCAHDYSTERVIRHGDHTVVIVRFHTAGFEGPDSRMIAVTGVTQLR
jgi:predicted secreted protein